MQILGFDIRRLCKVQLLLGRAMKDSAVRYLGVELEDALAISEAVETYLQEQCSWVAQSGCPTLVRVSAVAVRMSKIFSKVFSNQEGQPSI